MITIKAWEPFVKCNFESYCLSNNLSIINSLNYMFLEDLKKYPEKLKQLELFLSFFHCDLRSKNKPSSETKDLLRSTFFKTHNLFHHHLINQQTYDNPINHKGENIIKSRTLKDYIEDFCHTSGMYLNYQLLDNNTYLILFISEHPKNTNDWNSLKNDLDLIINLSLIFLIIVVYIRTPVKSFADSCLSHSANTSFGSP